MNYFTATIYHTLKALLSLFRVKTLGARILVIRDNKEVLLVKHTYLPGWYTIGGGIDATEHGREAAVRELHEEAGIRPLAALKLFGFYYNPAHKRDDYIALYVCEEFTQENVKSNEIAEVKWFPLKALPDDATPSTKKRVAEYLGKEEVGDIW